GSRLVTCARVASTANAGEAVSDGSRDDVLVRDPPLSPQGPSFWHGRAELVEQFGQVVVANDAIVRPRDWESTWMVKIPSLPGWRPVNGIYINRLIVDAAEILFARWQDLGGHEIKHMGLFAPRAKRGYPDQLSLHTYGIAFDLNPDDNPMQGPGDHMRTDIPA